MRTLNKRSMRRKQLQVTRIRDHEWLLHLPSHVPWSPMQRRAPSISLHNPQGSARFRKPGTWPYLLNNLSVFHVKPDDIHVAEGNNSKGPHHPRPVGVHHLVMDAVTKREKKNQGATASAAGQAHPQGSSTISQVLGQRSQPSSPQVGFV